MFGMVERFTGYRDVCSPSSDVLDLFLPPFTDGEYFQVPDWAMNFVDGKSLRPFSRLWWDEVVPTVLTVPDSHSQTVLHPEQDRVLSVRECARLQGFPDHFRFHGTVKQRYRQIGNAVAVSVSRALGYTLGLALLKQGGDGPLMALPPMFSHSHKLHEPSSPSSGVQE